MKKFKILLSVFAMFVFSMIFSNCVNAQYVLYVGGATVQSGTDTLGDDTRCYIPIGMNSTGHDSYDSIPIIINSPTGGQVKSISFSQLSTGYRSDFINIYAISNSGAKIDIASVRTDDNNTNPATYSNGASGNLSYSSYDLTGTLYVPSGYHSIAFYGSRNINKLEAYFFFDDAPVATASISDADKQNIADRVTSSTVIQTILTEVQNARKLLDGTSNAGKSLAATYDQAKLAAERPNVFRVIKGQAFTEIMYGEINGTSSGVTATSIAGLGYTTLTGTLNTEGVQKITIGGKDLLFKVAPTPSTGAPATVIFGS